MFLVDSDCVDDNDDDRTNRLVANAATPDRDKNALPCPYIDCEDDDDTSTCLLRASAAVAVVVVVINNNNNNTNVIMSMKRILLTHGR
jgi:hypothetical protein